MDEQEKSIAIEYTKRKLGARDCVIVQNEDFLDGSLAMLRYKDASGSPGAAYAYVFRSGNSIVCALFSNVEEFASYLKDKKWYLKQSSLVEARSFFASVDAISGIIALCMTALVIFLSVRDPAAKTPEILANSISVILGFYFGRATNREQRGSGQGT